MGGECILSGGRSVVQGASVVRDWLGPGGKYDPLGAGLFLDGGKTVDESGKLLYGSEATTGRELRCSDLLSVGPDQVLRMGGVPYLSRG
jgi:hypothetical protein